MFLLGAVADQPTAFCWLTAEFKTNTTIKYLFFAANVE